MVSVGPDALCTEARHVCPSRLRKESGRERAEAGPGRPRGALNCPVVRDVRTALVLGGLLACSDFANPSAAAATPTFLPAPALVRSRVGCALDPVRLRAALERRAKRAGADAGPELALARWRALDARFARAGRTGAEANAALDVRIAVSGGTRERYALDVDRAGVRIVASDDEAAFDAFATLAQAAERTDDGRLRLTCGRIEDAPAMRWRILSDDVSRGPLPTLRYFEERIRTIAGLKMNGYSPYFEHVFVAPEHPLPAPLDGIAPDELRALARYAARFHVALIPEQQTFAHMHGTLAYERYAPLAELPHGYLLSPAAPAGEAYTDDLIADELRAVPHPPFFHIGSDEPSDLGRGAARDLVARQGDGPVYARHVIDTANFVVTHGGGRPLIWDDALSQHPELFASLPKSLVFVNWHYGREKTFRPYIDRIARGGFEQLVAPGALNWNEIYPDLDGALSNIERFTREGKDAGVLGLFQTVWHDDGETLFEATWYPIAYAAASAWERGSVDRVGFPRTFARAFFGTEDARYASDLTDLARCGVLVRDNPREYGDYLFWSDPFASDLASVATKMDLSALRLAAEDAEAHLRLAPAPPLHANAARVMFLAARRYDALGREFQISNEARAYYDDARANVGGGHDGYVYRGLNVTKYLFWEERDSMLELEPLVRAAWEYEDRASHEASVLERYRVAADRAIVRADRITDATYRDYVAHKTLPSFDDAIGLETAP